jgi:hypothetical protein
MVGSRLILENVWIAEGLLGDHFSFETNWPVICPGHSEHPTNGSLGPAKPIESAGRGWRRDVTLTQNMLEAFDQWTGKETAQEICWQRKRDLTEGCGCRIAADKRVALRRV